ncbi:MAG: hypothetical protein ACT4N4_14670 [Rhodospirillales bacterium]
MAERQAEARFEHAGVRYVYRVHHDAERMTSGSELRAEDGRNEPLCLAVGGAWLIRGPRALVESLKNRRGMQFDDAGVFAFANEDDDEATRRIPAGHVLFHFFELPTAIMAEPAFRRFVGRFGLAALDADAAVGRLDLAPAERAALGAELAALVETPDA